MGHWQRIPMRFLIVAVLLTLPVVLVGACGGGFEEESTTPANVPELGAARLGAGAGPTPIPVTPTPTPTPSPTQLTLFDPIWEGTWTVELMGTNKDLTRDMVLEFMPKKMVGEGADRRRDEGAVFIEGNDGWMALSFVRVNEETGEVTFRVPAWVTKFDGVLSGDKITGTSLEQEVAKGTFEVQANRDKKPERRKTVRTGG